MSDIKKIAVFSNYSWAYTSSAVVRRSFPLARATLLTRNTDDVTNKHNFGMSVVELKNSSLMRNIRSFRRMGFDTAVIDYGFSIGQIALFFGMRFKRIFIIDFNAKGAIRPIMKSEFMRLLIAKFPYFVNKILIFVSSKFRMSACLGMPSEIFIETTTICNLRCVACPTGLGQLNRPPMMISREFFNEIVTNNKIDFRYLDVIYPFIFGEPLLNKNIFEYLHKLRELAPAYARMELHTNGNFKDSKELARKLLATGVDLVSVSVDATDKTSYESFRRGGDFETVCEFVRNLTDLKKEMGLSRPEIVMQMILTKYSEGQTEAFERLKDDLGADRVLFKGYFHEFTGLTDKEGYSIAPSNKDLAFREEDKRKIIDKKKNLCGWAYRAISIMCNGNVTPCCIDYNTALVSGVNVIGSSIKKIWNSKRYRQFRGDMLRGKIPICKKCFFS